jgi:RNA polymerase sigma factor (sigma-70 family)
MLTEFANETFNVQGFRDGRPEVLAEVYRRHVGQVQRIVGRGFWGGGAAGVRGRVRGVAPAYVPDLVQEVFARAFRDSARRSYDCRRRYSPFLAAIARNLVIDWLRRRRVELTLPTDLAEARADDGEHPWKDESPLRIVESYLAKIPDRLRSVFEQRYVLGRSQTAAAAALGITRQRLRTRENQLRTGLARALRRGVLTDSIGRPTW